ncbi:hypothetical protein ACWGJT_07165 [Streptomyces xantholiticus]|uniref:HEAT repeat domain-containing protein n=1 Tax=Streptomyces xantholiticus TaxID=68285 RepID=A0ABV1V1Y6_9ACTN|nr:hypothetical protein CGZ69_21840 [Streptomyces peucetius subsp. caesius ATCC 27952]
MTSKSLTALIAEADERGLAASALACLDRCLPLLAAEDDTLRPLWAGLAGGEEDWAGELAAARKALENTSLDDEDAALVRRMLGAAPSDWATEPLREWADGCSVAALEIHRRFDMGNCAPETLERCREGDAEGAGPLVAGELRRQAQILEILAEPPGGNGLRHALEVSTEGRRVLRAAVSRRARVTG